VDGKDCGGLLEDDAVEQQTSKPPFPLTQGLGNNIKLVGNEV